MSAPELPQPIYPSGPPPGPGPATPPPRYGPPATPPPPGGSGSGIGGNKNLLIAVGAVLVLVVVAAVGIALSGDDGSDTASGDRPSVAGDDTGGEASDRAQQVAAMQIIGAESSTVSCIAGALEGDQEMLDTLEGQTNVVLTDSSVASNYASMIMGCASPAEMVDQLVTALPTFGYDAYSVGCFEQQAASLTATDWEEFIQLLVQPDRASELEQMVGELTFC